MQKGFAPILVLIGIVIIIAIVVGAYSFGKNNSSKSSSPQSSMDSTKLESAPQPSAPPDETANWETFIGKTFSLKYPKEWVINTLGSASGDAFILSISLTENPDDAEQSFSLYERKYTSKTQIEAYIKKATQKNLSQLESTNLDGIIGYKEVESYNTNLFIPKENVLYEITMQKNTSSPMLVDLILTTFKFL